MSTRNLTCDHCLTRGLLVKNGHKHGLQNYLCRALACGKQTTNPIEGDPETIIENVRLAKKVQRHQDTNRIERKAFREYSRQENAYTEYTRELISVLLDNKLNTSSPSIVTDGRGAGIVQLSDLHFNELVDLPHNQYSFTVASRRLRRLAGEAKKTFMANHVGNVLIAFTGDLMNSDRRLDELLSNATNRSKATFLAIDILSQFIVDLAENFNISVVGVTGNEGRVDKEPGWSEIMATHNYDWTIHNMLAMRFRDSDVAFIHGDPLEQVVSVGGLNILLLHGHGVKAKTGLDDIVTKLIGKYSSRNIRIDHVLFGHIHQASIGDIYSRSSSLVGANAYSDFGLNVVSRASQNIFVIDELANINGFKIDLQNTTEDCYEIDELLSSYNVKSERKLHEHPVIHTIVI